MKRMITSALLAILALPALATSWKGDINGDGQVDMADMVAMAKAIKAGDADKTKYDLNASGRVDDADLHVLANLIIGGKLIEDSGLSIGIGGWDDSGEDFGGSVGAPPKKAGPANLRFYFDDPRCILETSETYATMGIESADNMPCGMLIDIEPDWGMMFDNQKYFELLSDSPVLDGHMLYGSAKVKEDDGHLRFIIFSKDLMPLKGTGEFGNLFYNSDGWSDIKISGQTVSPDSKASDGIEDQWIGKQWQYASVNNIWFADWSIPGWDIYSGETFGLQVEFDPWEASDKRLIWTSSDPNVAEVSSTAEYAEIRAVGAGNCTIKAQSVDNPNAIATYELTVHPRYVEWIDIWNVPGELMIGETHQLGFEVGPWDADNKTLSLTSSNPSVATISDLGLITALAEGLTMIRLEATDGGGAYNEIDLIVIDPSGSVAAMADGAKISVIGNELRISGLNGGTCVTVCQPSGNAVHDTKADGDTMTVTLPSSGVYLVTVGPQTHKIMI